jgi:hypothetical protein
MGAVETPQMHNQISEKEKINYHYFLHVKLMEFIVTIIM